VSLQDPGAAGAAQYYDEMRSWISMSETEKDIDFASEWTHLRIYFSVEQ